MYTYTITNKEFTKGNLRLTVTFSNGKDSFEEFISSSNPTSEWLDRMITNRLSELNSSETFVSELENKSLKKLDDTLFTIDIKPESITSEDSVEPK